MYHPRKAFSNLLRLHLRRSELVRESKAVFGDYEFCFGGTDC